MPFSHAQKTLAWDAFAFAETRLMQPVMIVIGEQAAATEIAGEQRAGAPAASHSLKAALEPSRRQIGFRFQDKNRSSSRSAGA